MSPSESDSESESSLSSDEEEAVMQAVGEIIQRRRVAVVAAAGALLSPLGPTGPKLDKVVSRKDWDEHVECEGPRQFRRMYRLSIEAFHDLLSKIQHRISTDNVERAERSAGSAVCPEIRLALTLRYLAGGSVWDFRSNYGVSICEFIDLSGGRSTLSMRRSQ